MPSPLVVPISSRRFHRRCSGQPALLKRHYRCTCTNCRLNRPLIDLLTTQVPLSTPVPVSERVEEWLEHLNAEMKGTLTSLLQECLRGQVDYERFPSQVHGSSWYICIYSGVVTWTKATVGRLRQRAVIFHRLNAFATGNLFWAENDFELM